MAYIFASKDKNGAYQAEEVVQDLDNFLKGIEYGDVNEGECQIWEYPAGKIFLVQPDREVEEAEYYSLPEGKNGTVWVPNLIEQGEDKERVAEAYNRLAKNS